MSRISDAQKRAFEHPLFRKNSALASTAVCNFVAAFLTGLVGMMVSHLLGPQGRGIYATALVWGNLFLFLVQVGINQSIVYASASDPSSMGRVVSATLLLFSVQSILLFLLAFGGVPLLSWYPPATREAIQIYLCSVPGTLLLIYLTCISLGSNITSRFNTMKIVSAVPPFLSVVCAALFGRNLRFLLVSLLLWSYLVSLIALWWITRQTAFRPRPIRATGTLRSLINYGLHSYWANISAFANMRIDQLLLSFAVTPATLGNYSVAASYSLLTYPLAATAANTAFARVASAPGNEKASHIWEIATKGISASAIALFILWLFRALFIRTIYGQGFVEATRLSSTLLLAALFLSANYILSDCLRGMNMPGTVSKAEGFSAILTVVGLYLAVPRFGVWGAAWVSLLSYAIVTAILVTTIVRALTNQALTSAEATMAKVA